jgi:6,7-dimethyl-8-ribityllumazine synthase
VSEHGDEPQDWPLRDSSTRLRSSGGSQPLESDELGQAEVLYEEGEPDPTGVVEQLDEPAPVEEAEQVEAGDAPAEAEAADAVGEAEPADEAEPVEDEDEEAEAAAVVPAEEPAEHAEGDLNMPGGYTVLEGSPNGERRSVAVVVSRFNGEITNRLLESALSALRDAGVAQDAILVMPVPGAFELPIAAMALAKTRRYACVVALGCVIRGETPHFDFVATEAASGLQLAGIETGVPVSFGVLTCDTAEQAEARVDRGAWAARSALEMADAFAQLRTAAATR